MPNIQFRNFARSTLSIGAASGALSLTVASGTGSRFPTLTGAQYFYATLENASLVREIVRVTARTGDTLTVVRAQDNTTAQSWNAGDTIALRLNAKAIEEAVVGTMLAANNLSDLADAPTARANLGAALAGPLASSGITGAAASGANSDITSLTGLTSAVAEVRQIQPISASVSGNALTISASALSLEFRSATLTSGAVSFVEGTPANLVISSGSTLGTINATQSRIVVLALNNAGTIELAAVNIAGGNDLSETGLISTIAEGGAGAADSASVIYSTTARTNVAYRVIGYVESTQATAGTWATAPSTIQGRGGQALAAMSSLGYGQTLQSVTRNAGQTYYNTTGKPIFFMMSFGAGSGSTETIVLTINSNSMTWIVGALVSGVSFGSNAALIPVGASYSYTSSAGLAKNISEIR